jgi:ABC-type antimicrobial peptide transport system permease subunit
MKMSKRKSTAISPKEDAESAGYLGLFGGFILAYITAEITLAAQPHPIHWLVAGTGAVLIGAAAYGITFWRLTRRRRP